MFPSLKPLFPLALLALPMLAHGEDYIAKIYGVPPGWNAMRSVGGGDDGMMSGFVADSNGNKAGYLTATGGFKNMNPANYSMSEITDAWGGTYHVGFGVGPSGLHGLFWIGGGNAIDMHPSLEYSQSYLFGGGGNAQAGIVTGNFFCAQCGFTTTAHAGAWARTPSSFKRLHSTTHIRTRAWGTDGTQFVGWGYHLQDGSQNALLWKSTSAIAINLRPSQSTQSQAWSNWGNQQGGSYKGPQTAGFLHAVIWAGTPGSAKDLNPNATFQQSEVKAVRNGLQVGWAIPLGNLNRRQAIAWHGSAGTWINLHSRLPYPYNLGNSFAEGIDNKGNIIGYINGPWGAERPIVWVRV